MRRVGSITFSISGMWCVAVHSSNDTSVHSVSRLMFRLYGNRPLNRIAASVNFAAVWLPTAMRPRLRFCASPFQSAIARFNTSRGKCLSVRRRATASAIAHEDE